MKGISVPIVCTMLALTASVARAQLDTPVWYVDYEATLKTGHTATMKEPDRGTIAWTIERRFSGAAKLDLRSDGAVLSANQSMIMDPDKLKNMSTAEQLKLTQEYMDAMQYTANWMPGPVEGVDDLEAMRRHMESASVPINITYEKVAQGVGTDEQGSKFDYERRTKATSSGHKIYLGDQFKFEINTSSKTYWLMLPYLGQDMSGTEGIDWVETGKTKPVGTTAWKDEEPKTRKSMLDNFLADFKPDALGDRSNVPVIEGTVGSSGKITGEKSFSGSISDGPYTVPVTLTYHYTLTTVPPARK